jgi:glycerol uptake facilitator-like aquaporin
MGNEKNHKLTCFCYEVLGTMWNIYGWSQVQTNWLAGGANLISIWCVCKPVSGAVFNPAQTFRNYILSPRERSDLEMMVWYLCAQFIGGFLAIILHLHSNQN